MKGQLKILLIEDSENDALLNILQIQKGGYIVDYDRVETAKDLKWALRSKKWDIILSDYLMPGFDGLEALSIFKETGEDIPFIIISGTIGENIAVEAMKAGAHDYIMKNNLHRLLPSIERELKELKIRIEKKELEIKQKEVDAIQASELKFRKLVSDIHVGVLIMDAKGKITTINHKTIELLGLSEKQILGKQPPPPKWKMIYEDKSEFPGFSSIIKQILTKGKPIRNLMVEVFRTGIANNIWVMIDIVPSFNKNNEIQQIVWTFVDRTERKKAIEALRESEELYRSILEASPDGIVITDIKGTIEVVSPSSVDIFGYENQGQILGRQVTSFVSHSDVKMVNPKYKELVEEISSGLHEYIGLKMDGSTFNIEVNGEIIKNEDNKSQRVVLIIRDITKRKQDELEMSKLTQTIEQSPISIVITDPDGIVEYVNPYFTNLTGYTKNEIIGNSPRILKSGQTHRKVYEQLWRTIKSGHTWRGEFCNIKKNGEMYWESANITPLLNRKGQITHYIGIKEDITRRKINEDEIKKKNEELTTINLEKDKFFSIVAHDLRSPFSTFLGLTKLILERLPNISEEQLISFISMLNQNANQLYQLLENLLQWANTQQGLFSYEPEPLNLFRTVKESVAAILNTAEEKNINVKFIIEEDLQINADLNMFRTIVRNLVSNAIKYTPTNGIVEIMATKKKSGMVEISIKDSGIGMDNYILSNLFKLGVKIKRNGTEGEPSSGLGLLLCKDFVEKHNGKLWAESIEGKGSTFHFTVKSD